MSSSGFHNITIDEKFCIITVFTFEGEHDYWFLHLTTFKARFLHLRLKFFLHLWLKKFLQLRVVFTNEVDFLHLWLIFTKWIFFTFEVVTGSLKQVVHCQQAICNSLASISRVLWLSNVICNVWISSCRSQRDENGNGDGETAAGSSSAKTAEKKMSARTEKSIISDEEFQRYGLYLFSVTP